MTRPLSLDDLYDIPFASDPQISPDGTVVAFVVTRPDRDADENRSTIWTVRTSGEDEPRELTTGGNDLTPRWSPDGRTLAFVSARNDGPQVYLLPADGGEARKLTDLPLGAGEPVWSPDGSMIAFAAAVDLDAGDDEAKTKSSTKPVATGKLDYKADGAGLLRGIRQHVFVAPVDGGVAAQLSVGDFFVSTPVWSPDGSEIAFSTSTSEDRDLSPTAVVHVVPADGGLPRAVTPPEGFYTVFDWSPDGETLLVAGRERLAVGHMHLYTVPVSGGEPRNLLPDLDRNVMVGQPAYPGTPPMFVDDGARILFCIRERGRVHLLSVGAAGGEPEVLVDGDRVVDRVSEAGGRIAFCAAAADSPGEVHVMDTGGERQLTRTFAEALPDVELVASEQRMFRAPDGTEIEGWILRKRDVAGRTPLLLDIHGGPHNAWSPVFDGVHLWHQTLVAQGWTVLFINPRGSDGYGEEFWSALLGDGWGRADEQDFLAALDSVIDEGLADPERLAVTGYSYGGYMTCWLTARTDRFAAAVPGGSVTDLLGEVGAADLGWYLGKIEFGTSPFENQDALAKLSPITHVTSVTTPTLLLHGENDDRCPISQAESWFTALRSRGVPTELVRYPGGSHLFILSGPPSHRFDYCRRVEGWVTKFAGDRDSGAPARSLHDRLPGLRQRLRLLTERHRVPAASVAVLQGDELVEEAVGVLNVETGIEATTDSLFQAGSIGKTYTATLVMQLVDEGLLDLDAPVVSVLPEFRVADPEVTRQVTMRHLLSHTSGIEGDHFADTGRGDDCLERFVETCAELGQTHPLGATFSYCNTGYKVAGRIVEKLTGKVWETALRARLLDPLGLDHTATLPEEAMRFRTAFGHEVEPGATDPTLASQWALYRTSGPAGTSITCPPRDLLTFAKMHLEEGRAADGTQVLSPGSVKAMQAAQVDLPDATLGSHWGLGWTLYDWDDHRLFGHGGNTLGQSAFLRVAPDQKLAVALMTNGGHATDLYRELMPYLLQTLAGITVPKRPEPLPDPGRLDATRYVGVYERVSGQIEIVERGGRLHMIVTVTGPLAKLLPKVTEEYELHPAGPDRFVLLEEEERTWTPVTFLDGPDGARYLFTGARVVPLVSGTTG